MFRSQFVQNRVQNFKLFFLPTFQNFELGSASPSTKEESGFVQLRDEEDASAGKPTHGGDADAAGAFTTAMDSYSKVEEKLEKYFGYLARCTTVQPQKFSKNRIKINQNAWKMPSRFKNRPLKTISRNFKSGPENL